MLGAQSVPIGMPTKPPTRFSSKRCGFCLPLPAPKGKQAKLKTDPAEAAKLIYNRYVSDVRELTKNRKIGMRVPLWHLLEGHNE